MSLFKKKGQKVPACACNGGCATEERTERMSGCWHQVEDGIFGIKVLGAGCTSCHKLYENTQKAVANMGLPVEVEYITELQKVMEYGVMTMPVLVINEKVVSMGKVLKPTDIEKVLYKLGF